MAGSGAEAPWELAETRSRSQHLDHWREFASIVAAGCIAAALVAGGRVLDSDHQPEQRVLLWLMLLASAEAFTLAYYSINLGSLCSTGVLRLLDVVAAFGVAASQLAMPAWVAHVAASTSVSPMRGFASDARPWLLFAAAFSFCAALANYAAWRRRKGWVELAPQWWQQFEKRQATDRLGALGSSALLLVVCGLSVIPCVAPAMLTFGAGLAILVFGGAILSQRRAAHLFPHVRPPVPRN